MGTVAEAKFHFPSTLKGSQPKHTSASSRYSKLCSDCIYQKSCRQTTTTMLLREAATSHLIRKDNRTTILIVNSSKAIPWTTPGKTNKAMRRQGCSSTKVKVSNKLIQIKASITNLHPDHRQVMVNSIQGAATLRLATFSHQGALARSRNLTLCRRANAASSGKRWSSSRWVGRSLMKTATWKTCNASSPAWMGA